MNGFFAPETNLVSNFVITPIADAYYGTNEPISKDFTKTKNTMTYSNGTLTGIVNFDLHYKLLPADCIDIILNLADKIVCETELKK